MKKIINDQNAKDQLWLNWLISRLDSYEPFKEFALGHSPEEVAEDFILSNKDAISEVFEKFDEEDKDLLDQFQKLTECEMHVLKTLKLQIHAKSKVRYVDFGKKKIKSSLT